MLVLILFRAIQLVLQYSACIKNVCLCCQNTRTNLFDNILREPNA